MRGNCRLSRTVSKEHSETFWCTSVFYHFRTKLRPRFWRTKAENVLGSSIAFLSVVKWLIKSHRHLYSSISRSLGTALNSEMISALRLRNPEPRDCTTLHLGRKNSAINGTPSRTASRLLVVHGSGTKTMLWLLSPPRTRVLRRPLDPRKPSAATPSHRMTTNMASNTHVTRVESGRRSILERAMKHLKYRLRRPRPRCMWRVVKD